MADGRKTVFTVLLWRTRARREARQQEVVSMRGILRLCLASLLGGWLLAGASLAWGQANNTGGNTGGGGTNNTNNNTNNGNNISVGGSLPAGVIISPEGVLRVKPFTDRSGDLTRTRIVDSKARMGTDILRTSPRRKISLQRLEAAMGEPLAA